MRFDCFNLFAYCPPWFAAVSALLIGITFLAIWWTVAAYFGAHDAANNRFEQQQATQSFVKARWILLATLAVLFLWLTLVAALTHLGTPD